VDRPLVLASVPLVPRRSEDPLLLVPLVPRRSEDPLLLVPLVVLHLVPTCAIWLYHLFFANSLFSDFFLGFSMSFHFSTNPFDKNSEVAGRHPDGLGLSIPLGPSHGSQGVSLC